MLTGQELKTCCSRFAAMAQPNGLRKINTAGTPTTPRGRASPTFEQLLHGEFLIMKHKYSKKVYVLYSNRTHIGDDYWTINDE